MQLCYLTKVSQNSELSYFIPVRTNKPLYYDNSSSVVTEGNSDRGDAVHKDELESI